MPTKRKRSVLDSGSQPHPVKLTDATPQTITNYGVALSAAVGGPARERYLNPFLNQLADDRLHQRDYLKYLTLFASQNATAAFAEIASTMTDEEFVTVARDVWERDDQPSVNFAFWQGVLTRCRSYPQWFMKENERERLRALANPSIAYRGAGFGETAPAGFAWTLERGRAEFFAHEYLRGGRIPGGHVFRAEVDPLCAIGYLGTREEAELLFMPESIVAWVRE